MQGPLKRICCGAVNPVAAELDHGGIHVVFCAKRCQRPQRPFVEAHGFRGKQALRSFL